MPTPSTAALPPPATPGFFHRQVVTPLIDLLRVGCSPRQLAWSIAVGIVVGINPLLGSTTVLALAAAALLRLNLLASQLAAHLCYPLEILLFFFFIRAGNRLFHTGRMPLHREALLAAIRHHPIQTTRILWPWEWHALIIWAALALLAAPVLAVLLTPILTRLNSRIHLNP